MKVDPLSTTISALCVEDVDSVDALMKRCSGTVGFLPLAALRDHLEQRCVLGAKNSTGDLIGYILYAANRDRFRVAQLVVAEGYQGQQIARRLLEALKATATTQKVIRLTCRNDFPAHRMWPQLGFVPVDERPGRSEQGYPLTLWRLTLAADDQLALFRANVSEEVLDVIVDAQIFYDFDEADTDHTQPSKVLLSDTFIDSLNIWFTDELFVEIGRNHNSVQRRQARERAKELLEIKYDLLRFERFRSALQRMLPSNTQSQVSDINHLAKAASSDVRMFITRDDALLRRASEIRSSVGVHVLGPTELILRLSELSGKHVTTSERVAGLSLEWRRLTAQEFAQFPFGRFLEKGERLSLLRRRLERLLARPNPALEVLWSEDHPIAFRVLTHEGPKSLAIALARTTLSEDQAFFGSFLMADVVYRAVRDGMEMVSFETQAVPSSLTTGLSEMGFIKDDSKLVRLCLPRYMSHADTLRTIARLSPDSLDTYGTMSSAELEVACSPLASDAEQNYFVIPIREGYAMNLFDRQRSARALIGGTPEVLLRWHNVYYRTATLHKMIQAPGRLLWYISGGPKEIVAVSHLDQVVIGPAKDLLRRFQRYGTLDWNDLYRMSNGDASKPLMALRFSHTFPFQCPVSLTRMWKVLDEEGIGRSIQGPRKISANAFVKLFRLGYPENS